MSNRKGLKAKLKYWFDNFMSKGGFSIFMALLFLFVLFSSLVAFITSEFEAKLDELKKGKSRVMEKDYTLRNYSLRNTIISSS